MKQLYLLLVVISSASLGNAQTSFSLSEAIQYGMESNRNIDLKEKDILIADEQIKEYKSIGMPKISGSVNYQYFFQLPAQPIEDFLTPTLYNILFDESIIERRELGPPDVATIIFQRPHNLVGGVEASILAFDGSYLVGVRGAKLFKELVKKEVEATKQDIRGSITKAYMAVLIAEENYTMVQKNVTNTEKLLSDTKILFTEGFAESLDVDRLSLSYNNLVTQVEKTGNSILIAKNLLKFQMGYPMERIIELSEDLESIIKIMNTEMIDMQEPIQYINRHEYGALEMGRELNKLDMERFQKKALPSLRLFLSGQQGLYRSNLFRGSEAGLIPSAFGGFGLSVPIYDGGEKNSQVQQAKINIDKNDIQIQEYKHAIQMQVMNAKISMANTRKELQNINTALEITERIYEKTQIKFREGVGSSLEVSQAEANLFSMQTMYINALYDLISAKTELDIALGNL